MELLIKMKNLIRNSVYRSYRTQLLINNEWVNAATHKTFPTLDPSNEQKIADVQRAGDEDLDKAVMAAKQAFEHGPWRRTTARERGQMLYKLADLIEANADELAKLETLDNGKPISDSKNVDVPLTASTYRYYAGLADKVQGKTIPIDGPFFCYSRYEPIGVVGQIIPWNFPLALQSWKLGPALAAGNTVVMKPAEQTPLSALKVGELIVEAGFPPGVVNLLPGFGDVGAALSIHPEVDKIAFTGSTEVGKLIAKNSGERNLKRVTLELGGKSPNIILDDADIDQAIKQSQIGLYFNQGQCCIAGSRLFVHERIYDAFVEKSVECSRSRKLGDPFDEATQQGPQVDKTQFDRIMSYIEKGKAEGAKLCTGGVRWGNKGYYIEPTVFSDVTDEMTIAKEEIFGPVMSIMKFKDMDEVIKRANATHYGLGAGVVTKDLEKALHLVNALRVGTVYVNCYDVLQCNTPFGGYKDSGVGKELGEDAIYSYLESKTVIMKKDKMTLP